MSLENCYKDLLRFTDVIDLNKPLLKEEYESYLAKGNTRLPKALLQLLRLFDGGEIFIPGTIIYGVKSQDWLDSINDANIEIKNHFAIPEDYVVFAKYNFGDFVCINKDEPNNVIQWDHESDEEFCSWDSLETWLSEEISNYEEDM